MSLNQINTSEHPIKAHIIEGLEPFFLAHFTGKTWNGFDCPLFDLEQAKALVEILNQDEEFKASIVDGTLFIHLFSSGDTIEVESVDGYYEIHGWCFQAVSNL